MVYIPTGKIYYIGSTKRKLKERFHDHVYHKGRPIYEIIKKYGRNNFKLVVIDTSNTQEDIFEKEKFWTEFWRKRTYLYNIDSGKSRAESVKCKLSEIGRDYTGEKNNFYGHKHSDKSKRKMRTKKLGKKHTKEHIEKFKASNTDNVYKNSKTVMCVNTGEVFATAAIASRKYGVYANGIRACCNGTYRYSGELNGERLVWKYI